MKKVLVIGSNSFSGQDFIDLLLLTGRYYVIGISRSEEKDPVFLRYKQNKNLSSFRFYQIDLNKDLDKLGEIIQEEKPVYIVNFAAQSEVAPSWIHPEHWYQTNCVSLAKLINFLKDCQFLEKYVHISSPEVYGSCTGLISEDAPLNPSTPYAASKAAADMLLSVYRKQFNFPVVTVRSTNVYGARQQLFKIIPRAIIYYHLGKKVQLHGGGKAVKSYIHIRDISEGELKILENGKRGEIYHLSPHKGISIKELIEKICALLGISFKDFVEVVEERPGQDKAYLISSEKARKEFGWQPKITLEEGLREVKEWVERNWDVIKKMPLEYLHKP
ncbi:MAG: NAD-dependent epimerase/dehydratase family protein [Candidatus Dadabacteria bacterium]|nr:MAG: NAD-dependent epimerase/dehydratase family protein [Candidatus Dadabacteria bacterium]